MKERSYPVYAEGSHERDEPFGYVNQVERNALLRDKAATPFGHKRRCLRLKPDAPGNLSQYMGAGVMFANAVGDVRARVATLLIGREIL